MSLTADERQYIIARRDQAARQRVAAPIVVPSEPRPTAADVQAAKIKALELEIDVLSRDLRDALKQPPKETGLARVQKENRELIKQLEQERHKVRVSIQRNQILANKLAKQAA